MPKTTVGKLAFHVHHDRLVERLTEPIEVRQAYIRENKPSSEREVRLRLLRLVKGSLPTAVEEAWAAYDEARVAREKAWTAYMQARDTKATAGATAEEVLAVYAGLLAACNKAGGALQQALQKHATEIDTLHQRECPNCPWDGETIFPKEEEV